MSLQRPCEVCGCSDPRGTASHAVAGALASGDLDAAIESGLLDCPGCACAGCEPTCTGRLVSAREERLSALAARERYRARSTRLQSDAMERAARRAAPAPADVAPALRPALPAAAAAALARAKARAAGLGEP